jgi:hypothetical protein
MIVSREEVMSELPGSLAKANKSVFMDQDTYFPVEPFFTCNFNDFLVHTVVLVGALYLIDL